MLTVTKLPGYQLHLYYTTCVCIEIMVTKWLLLYFKLVLQTLRNMPNVTKLPGYQLHLYYKNGYQMVTIIF